MLRAVKLALAITVDDFDPELSDLIQAALYDLQTNGINATLLQSDPLILQAVKTYCRAHFHSPADYDRLLAAYEEQKGHLMKCTGYTDFGEAAPLIEIDEPAAPAGDSPEEIDMDPVFPGNPSDFEAPDPPIAYPVPGGGDG